MKSISTAPGTTRIASIPSAAAAVAIWRFTISAVHRRPVARAGRIHAPRAPQIVTGRQTLESLRVVLAEIESAKKQSPVAL